jgi:5,10-methylenetetrahydromethanopterin reductase
MTTQRLGVMFDRARPPEDLSGFARELEAVGVDEIWVVEDLGWGGAISAAATALAATGTITVGIGIVPAPLRNPAVLAMELATLARLHPSRLLAGIGHGVGSWMTQVGAGVASPLTLLEESFVAVRALLAGELVELNGRYVHLAGVQLVHPPRTPPPLLAGVMKPRSLALAGRLADGTILAEGTGPQSIAAALGYISAPGPHQLVVLTHLCVDDDEDAVERALAPVRHEFGTLQGTPASEVFTAAGTALVAAQYIRSLWEAGADTVVLRPVGGSPIGMVREVLAALRT